jgi:hypothetical protein
MGVWKMIQRFCIWFAAYYLLRSLILFVADLNASMGVGYGFAIGIFLAAVGWVCFCSLDKPSLVVRVLSI